MWFLIILFCCIGCIASKVEAQECNSSNLTEADVQRVIFAGDEQQKQRRLTARPKLNPAEPVDVKLALLLTDMNINELNRIVELTATMYMTWIDEVHTWNASHPDLAACVPSLRIENKAIWLPDIVITNSDSTVFVFTQGGIPLRLKSNGVVHYSAVGRIRFFCNFDLTYFPFDKQHCTMRIESWVLTRSEQTFSIDNSTAFDFYYFNSPNQQWNITSVTVKATTESLGPNFPDYDVVFYNFNLIRKPNYYLMNAVIPSVIISLVELVTFALPSNDVVKVHISFTCLLAYTVFQAAILPELPQSSDSIPLMTIYLNLQMIYIGFVLMADGVIFLIHDAQRHRHQNQQPKFCFAIQRKSSGVVAPAAPVGVIQRSRSLSILDPRLPFRSSRRSKNVQSINDDLNRVISLINGIIFVVYLMCSLISPVIVYGIIP